jgi:dTDP-4-dehydrorhamnose reductase
MPLSHDQRPLVWVTGAGGLIGHALVHAASQYAPQWLVKGWLHPQLELTDRAALRQAFHADRPEAVIHCAALTRSVACENNPSLAHLMNVDVTRWVAESAADIPLIFFSTNLVFDGVAGHYDEQALVNPLNVYAGTKVEAESLVLANPRHTVVRIGLTGGISPRGDRGFNEEARRAGETGQTLNLFVDEYRTPIAADVTARAVWDLLASQHTGLYHLCGAERLSRLEIGQALATRWPHLTPRIHACSRTEYRGPSRPQDTSMNCAKLQSLLRFPLPHFRQWLAEHPESPF